MQRYSYEEMMLLRAIELNSLLPHYWSELFTLMSQLLDEKETQFLQQQLVEIENYVLSEAQIKAGYSLYDIEMAIESNPDYYAYFENPRGNNQWREGSMRKIRNAEITKFDVERKLNKVKSWIFAVVRKRAEGRRFNRMR